MLGVLTLRQSRPTIIANIEVERLKLERKRARQQIKDSTEKLKPQAAAKWGRQWKIILP